MFELLQEAQPNFNEVNVLFRTAQVLNENENDDENEKHGFLQTAMLLLGGKAECYSQLSTIIQQPSTF